MVEQWRNKSSVILGLLHMTGYKNERGGGDILLRDLIVRRQLCVSYSKKAIFNGIVPR